MFEEYMNKRVKIVFKDGEAIKTLRGIHRGIDGDESARFFKVELEDGKVHSIKLANIDKVSEVGEDEGYSQRPNDYSGR